jgi:hypothetical protein
VKIISFTGHYKEVLIVRKINKPVTARCRVLNNLDRSVLITIKSCSMAYYIVTVKENKAGARRRRKLVVTSRTKPEAMISIQDMCRGTGFIPDYKSVNEISSNRYFKTVGTLLGRAVNRPSV